MLPSCSAMSADETYQLIAPVAFALPTLVWAIVAWLAWRLLLVARPVSPLFRILPVAASFMALRYALEVFIPLTPTGLDGRVPELRGHLRLLGDLIVTATVPLFRHLVPLAPVRGERLSTAWITRNYGSAVVVAGIVMAVAVTGLGSMAERHGLTPRGIAWTYALVMCGLMLWDMARLARRGAWSAGSAVDMRSADVLVVAAALIVTLVVAEIIMLTMPRTSQRVILIVSLHTVAGVAFALPFAARVLGEVFRRLAATVLTLASTAVLYAGGRALAAGVGGNELRHLVDIGTVLTLALALVIGRVWLRRGIDRLSSRDSRRFREALQTVLQTLSPEQGVLACCQATVEALTRVLRVRGAAVVLFDSQGALSHGAIDLAPLRHVWAGHEATRLPGRSFGSHWLADAPLKEALIAAQATLVVPIVSPRRRWGHLFLASGFLAVATRDDNVEMLEGFAAQLALVLDGAEILARAVAVERALGHAEKLAAIGELAARTAHEIRNPVTAARSLAQLLCRDPASPLNVEHAGLILAELERVERHIQALLRFARREELRLEPMNLTELVRATVDEFRPRLQASGVEVTLDLREPVTVRADREKLRQVLINLIENALDALEEIAGPRTLALAVQRTNGTAAVQVTDSGPGVSAEALPQLFEPFFSQKAKGTGLGLAIAKRAVDEHGGRIEAARQPGSGMRFRIELPLQGR